MTRKRKIILFCLLPPASLLLALIIVNVLRFVQGPRRELGDQTIAILNGATRVETFRLNDSRDGDQVKEGTIGEEIVDYPLISQGPTLGPSFAAKVSKAVQDPRTFASLNDTTCLINPGIAFRVWYGPECAEVIVCFHCGQMLITSKNAQGHKLHTTYTEFRLMRAEFLALAKKAFPGDQEIQRLL